MPDQTLKDAADATGISYTALRQDAARGKLKTTRDGQRTMVSDENLAAYLASKGLRRVAESIERDTTRTVTNEVRELGNIFANLSPALQSAILEGIPRTSNGKTSGGNAEAWRRATKNRPEAADIVETSDDPHFGHPIGFQHKTSPRWKRISESTWELNGATVSWNGFLWEGGGIWAGRTIEDESVSPGAPASDRRPLAPSKPVPVTKGK
jgi:hypothetical protein